MIGCEGFGEMHDSATLQDTDGAAPRFRIVQQIFCSFVAVGALSGFSLHPQTVGQSDRPRRGQELCFLRPAGLSLCRAQQHVRDDASPPATFGRCAMPESRADPRERGVSVRERAHHSRPAADLTV
jgi:hypothetical protein